MIQAECKLLGAAVVLVLIHGAGAVLPRKLVFQLQRHHRDAVYREHHINGVCIGGGITELPGTAKDICFIPFHSFGVQPGLRLEIAHPQLAAHILDAVAENKQKPLIGDGGFQTVIQLFFCFFAVIAGIFCPFFGLSLGDKLAQYIHIDALFYIVLTVMYPVTVRILSVELHIPALRRDQEGFNVSLEPFLAFVHDVPLIFSEAVLPL